MCFGLASSEGGDGELWFPFQASLSLEACSTSLEPKSPENGASARLTGGLCASSALRACLPPQPGDGIHERNTELDLTPCSGPRIKIRPACHLRPFPGDGLLGVFSLKGGSEDHEFPRIYSRHTYVS